MILMGLDIASYKSGWFVLDTENIRFKIGLINAKGDAYNRIRQIGIQSKKLINSYNPEIIIIEDTYLDSHRKHKGRSRKRGNINTLKLLEKCHGAIIANTNDYTDIYYMTPSEHKEILTGIGNAPKQATIWSIQKKLGLSNIDDNQADAAALILAYLVQRQQWDLLEQIKTKFEK